MIFIFIGVVVILLFLTVLIITRKYKKELMSQEWYNDFQYEYQSVNCPHKKHIKLADTDWKFAFTMKKEKTLTVKAGPYSNKIHQVHYRHYCEECGQKRWFEQTNSVRDHKGLFRLRLKYLAIGFVLIMLLFVLSMNIIFRMLIDW